VDARLEDDFLFGNKVIHTTGISSNVQAISYDANTRILLIWFYGGNQPNRRYSYKSIHLEVARRFFRAASKGKWVWSDIRRAGIPYLDKTIAPPPG
jgi:hypothetical protein